MITLQISFSFAGIGTNKSKNLIVHVIFLNEDSLLTILDIAMKFSMSIPYIKGGVSQILYLWPSLYYCIDKENTFWMICDTIFYLLELFSNSELRKSRLNPHYQSLLGLVRA